ncbi:MAG: hypothetical protein K2G88_03315, partial [Oscillospiraceae bacterium]|nr:hypothetical protein [Oscillospiraceae bacterium]
MKKKLMTCFIFFMLLTGCSNAPDTDIPTSLESESEQAQQEEQPVTEPVTEATPRDLYYITSNQTEDIANLNIFIDKIKSDGYLWHEVSILELPENAETVIYNSPQEDMTSEEYAILDNYMNTGG